MNIGSLGNIRFEGGIYAYIGSAQNNLEKRVARHFRRDKRSFWHIDYLLSGRHIKILEVFFKVAPKSEECRTAEMLRKVGEPIKGFGSSDCKCIGHLLKVSDYEKLKRLIKNMNFMKLELEKLA